MSERKVSQQDRILSGWGVEWDPNRQIFQNSDSHQGVVVDNFAPALTRWLEHVLDSAHRL